MKKDVTKKKADLEAILDLLYGWCLEYDEEKIFARILDKSGMAFTNRTFSEPSKVSFLKDYRNEIDRGEAEEQFQSVLKESLLERLKVCPPCCRLNTVINRLSIDNGRTMYTSAEVLWIVQMITGTENEPAEGSQTGIGEGERE